ncbi:response regulator transcription factor [Neorhizobium sp. BT27B]|uniref:response regulator transcription factor n=1 Tax=Neorhizobium sp. BT27B TaxID=3142625 RepID=UPI003D28DD5C
MSHGLPPSVRRTGSVLIADPQAEGLTPLIETLRRADFAVETFPTLTRAIAGCHDLRPAFVLTELRFPDGSGYDLARVVRAVLPTARTVVHTWFADIHAAVAAVKAGADEFVPKPTDPEFLSSILLGNSRWISSSCRIAHPNSIRRSHVEQILRSNGSNVSETARRLGLHRRSLQRMLERYDRHRATAADL